MNAWDLSEPLLFAHRGAATECVENTLPAFARALACGADVLELDVRMSADGQIVVAHDETGERLADLQHVVAASTLAQLRTWRLFAPSGRRREPARMASLAEVLEAFPNAALNIDLKQDEPDMVPALLCLLAARHAQARVLLTSFSAATLGRVRRAGYAGPMGMSQLDALRAVCLPKVLNRLTSLGGTRLQIPTRHGPLDLTTPRCLQHLHAQGFKVDYWVVNDPCEVRRLLDLGADGIVTDDPRAIALVFRTHPRCQGFAQRHPQHPQP